METIGQRAKRARLALGLKQSDIAERAKCREQTIGQFERGVKLSTMYTFIEIARALGVSLDYLAYGEDHGNEKRN